MLEKGKQLKKEKMSGSNAFVRYSWFVLFWVLLVIAAGGIVRMTQSGMGCPDWPRCFGMWIPPSDVSQLPVDFEKYLSKQDIDHNFNVYHTWIEYINRLLGAILGIFIFIYFVWSVIKYRATEKWIPLLIGGLVLLTGFQGWMGKLVVDANLSVVKITLHMLIALLIAAIPLYIIRRIRYERVMVPAYVKQAAWVLIGAVLIQIILGTQVREEIDIISKNLSYQQRDLWIGALGVPFYIHRSFSWLILIVSGYLWFKSKDFTELRLSMNFIMICTITAMLAGIAMNYLDMPAIAQPIHLVVGSMLFMGAIFFRLRLE